MTQYLLAGGGTAGHVNPLLAVADRLKRDDPECAVAVVGTDSGLETELVPARGFELITIDKVPLPRRVGADAFRFPARLARVVRELREIIRNRGIDVVVGFGGFVSAPAYLAAWREKVPVVVHEANAVPGFANRLGSKLTRYVGVAFAGTRLRHARLVGMPLAAPIEELDTRARREEALRFFGFDGKNRILLVTGGSQGARSINTTVSTEIESLLGIGWDVLHIVGRRSELGDSGRTGYRVLSFCNRMDLAFSAADFVISRAGSATVSELTALGLPAVYVPYPFGNGEQERNTAGVVAAGGAIMIDDATFTPSWVRSDLIPLLKNPETIADLAAKAARIGVRDGTARTVALIGEALEHSRGADGDQD